MIATDPRTKRGDMFDDAGGARKPRVGQIALSYDPDEQVAVVEVGGDTQERSIAWAANDLLPAREHAPRPARRRMGLGRVGHHHVHGGLLHHITYAATISQPPDEDEILLFDKPVVEG